MGSDKNTWLPNSHVLPLGLMCSSVAVMEWYAWMDLTSRKNLYLADHLQQQLLRNHLVFDLRPVFPGNPQTLCESTGATHLCPMWELSSPTGCLCSGAPAQLLAFPETFSVLQCSEAFSTHFFFLLSFVSRVLDLCDVWKCILLTSASSSLVFPRHCHPLTPRPSGPLVLLTPSQHLPPRGPDLTH